ncbi:GTP cyclohydrolase II [Loigolactobacillus jiayinensis]|uniref:GTP cyclohydrolase-2 n=1 Tax=Loigolactobacillus jiayinensis TaxID=2486016 RepID=A0ABW1RD43_9LACO|nr:GTP cyclohydrolase II [Loigolactobacillus jiayinensis]
MKNNAVEKIEAAIAELKQGHLIIIADSTDREAEGDMMGLAEYVTPETVNHMVTKARGLLCVPMSATYATRLGLHKMVTDDTDAFGTAFTISTDAKTTTTGISAFDRADTIKQLAESDSQPDQFYHPGHIFPLISRTDGVLERTGHTEAAVDLAKIAAVAPVAYICEILKKDGTMARRKDLKAIAEGSKMLMITVDELIEYRKLQNQLTALPVVKLPTKYGDFMLEAFSEDDTKEPTLLIYKGDLTTNTPVLLRLHSECLTGDTFKSQRCDCGAQLERALQKIEVEGRGAVLYMRQEGRGIGLLNKIKAYRLQEQGFDTVEANTELGFAADQRDYALAARILQQKGISDIRLMTNNPDKIAQLTALGITVTERIPLEIPATLYDRQYLVTKKAKFHHLLREVN